MIETLNANLNKFQKTLKIQNSKLLQKSGKMVDSAIKTKEIPKMSDAALSEKQPEEEKKQPVAR